MSVGSIRLQTCVWPQRFRSRCFELNVVTSIQAGCVVPCTHVGWRVQVPWAWLTCGDYGRVWLWPRVDPVVPGRDPAEKRHVTMSHISLQMYNSLLKFSE